MATEEKSSKEIVDLLRENELVMMKLYEEFSKFFLVHEKFWSEIAREEESHAAWIETLYEKMKTNLVDFAEKRFPIYAIQSNIEFMNNTIDKVRKNELTSLQALEMAFHMERGMLESKFFEVFSDDSMELQIILNALRVGTQEHLKQVEIQLKKEKMGSQFEKEVI